MGGTFLRRTHGLLTINRIFFHRKMLLSVPRGSGSPFGRASRPALALPGFARAACRAGSLRRGGFALRGRGGADIRPNSGAPLARCDPGFGGSSNGRTADSDSACLGSNPSPPATLSLSNSSKMYVARGGMPVGPAGAVVRRGCGPWHAQPECVGCETRGGGCPCCVALAMRGQWMHQGRLSRSVADRGASVSTVRHCPPRRT